MFYLEKLKLFESFNKIANYFLYMYPEKLEFVAFLKVFLCFGVYDAKKLGNRQNPLDLVEKI